MVHDGQDALVVDPGDAQPVIDALQRLGLKLGAILVTHRHADHVAGIASLRRLLDGPIYGPSSLVPAHVDHPVSEGNTVSFCSLTFQVWETPGHTLEHLSFVCREFPTENVMTPLVFCGDTLFSAGCGRLFDGHPEQLWASLNRLAQLPEQTKICPTHEYTMSNLAFALAVEPDHGSVRSYRQHCMNLRDRQLPTLPTVLSIEREINPFLRLSEPKVISAARQHGATDESPLAVFTALRAWKNIF